MAAIIRMRERHRGHSKTSSANTRAINRAQGNVFRGFADLAAWLAAHLRVGSAVLDAEILCLDSSGPVSSR
jgi:hypothetical protein